MHATQREQAILDMMRGTGFVTFQELDRSIAAAPATIRRDLEKLARAGRIARVRGGAKLKDGAGAEASGTLSGVPFHENIGRNLHAKQVIGRAAAMLCRPGEGVMIDGGSTTLQMCPHLEGLGLQVLTNSLHIVSALLSQAGTRVLVPGGAVFREQNIILSAGGEDLMPSFAAPKLFMGAAGVGPQGLMQADVVLVAAERRLIQRAQQVILLVDSSKFEDASGYVVCGLDQIDVIITDSGVPDHAKPMLNAAAIRVIIAG